jgi:phosphate butyryltransferase
MTETAGRQGLDLSALSVGQSAEEVRRITPNALVFYTMHRAISIRCTCPS